MRDGSEHICMIMKSFEDLLEERGIQIKCKDKHEENERLENSTNNETSYCLYGMEYCNIVDKIEAIFDEHDRRNDTILHNILQELLNKTFDYNYEEFENWIKTEIGITSGEIDSLRRVGLYVADIDGKDL